ncbi:MAG: carbon-nitrogen hydrolase family protein [Acidobacteriota bacterium]
MRIALAQIYCGWGEIEGNLDRMARYARMAADRGAELVVFPELTVSGICKDSRIFTVAEDLDGASVRRLSLLAGELGIALGAGLSERTSGRPYNTYCLFGPDGRLAGAYRKQFIPQLEQPYWQPAAGSPVIELLGRRFGVAICWDNTHPDLLDLYGRQGVDCVLMPHAWDADALDERGNVIECATMEEIVALHRQGGIVRWRTHDEMLAYFLSYIPGLARRNRFAAVFVSQCGRPHPSLDFVGPSFVVDSTGELVAATRDGSEGLLVCELEAPTRKG